MWSSRTWCRPKSAAWGSPGWGVDQPACHVPPKVGHFSNNFQEQERLMAGSSMCQVYMGKGGAIMPPCGIKCPEGGATVPPGVTCPEAKACLKGRGGATVPPSVAAANGGIERSRLWQPPPRGMNLCKNALEHLGFQKTHTS